MLSLIESIREHLVQEMITSHSLNRLRERIKPEYFLVVRENSKIGENEKIGTYYLEPSEIDKIFISYNNVISKQYREDVKFCIKIYNFNPYGHIINESMNVILDDDINRKDLLRFLRTNNYGVYISDYNPPSIGDVTKDSADGIYLIIKNGKLATFLFHRERDIKSSLYRNDIPLTNLHYNLDDLNQYIG